MMRKLLCRGLSNNALRERCAHPLASDAVIAGPSLPGQSNMFPSVLSPTREIRSQKSFRIVQAQPSGLREGQANLIDEVRPISAFTPCLVSIYKTTGGEVFFSRMNTEAFAPMLAPEVTE